ncbi:MAG: hypothetical protein KGN32_08190 [Burkholderiales bacterium]|nr:hypothetical protein [Burkholderiales bacterium]
MTPMDDIEWTRMVEDHLKYELDHSAYWSFLATAPQPWSRLAHRLFLKLMYSIDDRLYRGPYD